MEEIIIERLVGVKSAIRSRESNRNISSFGRKFVDDFLVVMINLSEGKACNKTNGDWVFEQCSFADQRANKFVFRRKFFKKMNADDRYLLNMIVSSSINLIKSRFGTNMTTKEEKEKGISIINTCNEIKDQILEHERETHLR